MKMRILVLTTDNPYSNLMIRSLIDEDIVEIEAIIQSTTYVNNKTPIGSIFYIIKKTGFFFFFFKRIEFFIYLYFIQKDRLLKPIKKRKILTLNEISKHYSVPLFKIYNINSEHSIRLINKLNPDLIVSIFYTEILKNYVINIPK